MYQEPGSRMTFSENIKLEKEKKKSFFYQYVYSNYSNLYESNQILPFSRFQLTWAH